MALHLLISHASAASDAAAAALATLQWPNLNALLQRLAPTRRLSGDEYSLNPPHERVLGELHGWQAEDGGLPFAAWRAAQDGLPADPAAGWGLLTPCHWHVGSDQVALIDPELLELQSDESQELLEALRPSFAAEGWQLDWGAPLRWYTRHPVLIGLKSAALERAVGRNLDLWLRSQDLAARRLRRLQVEAQMLWHEHPVNSAREARGLLPVNSFWLSGCGRAQPGQQPDGLEHDERLRTPMLRGDWPAWCAAWRALDAGPLAELLARSRHGEQVTLTLCGERHAQRFETSQDGWLRQLRRRWQPPLAAALLADL